MSKSFLVLNKLFTFFYTGFWLGYILLNQVLAHDLIEIAELSLTPTFNNVPPNTYKSISKLKGDAKSIQEKTKGIWPRQRRGSPYSVEENNVEISQDENYLRIRSNNLPDHPLYRNNPNCALGQNYLYKIPLKPEFLNSPVKINSNMQSLGVAINGVVIAGPYVSQSKIAPYNRKIDQCASHSDKEGMYHCHFAPLCLKNKSGKKIALDPGSFLAGDLMG